MSFFEGLFLGLLIFAFLFLTCVLMSFSVSGAKAEDLQPENEAPEGGS